MFPCSLKQGSCSLVPYDIFPLFPCSPKPLGDPYLSKQQIGRGLQPRKCSSRELRNFWTALLILLRTNFGKRKRFCRKIKATLYVLKQTSFVELSITKFKLRTCSVIFSPCGGRSQWRAVLKIIGFFMFWIQLFHLRKMPLMNSKAIEISQSKNCPHGAIFPALTGDPGKLCHGKCKSR